jgi:hypothetical protein
MTGQQQFELQLLTAVTVTSIALEIDCMWSGRVLFSNTGIRNDTPE